MPNWFRQGPSPHQTALAMIGAKSGDRVIVIGADDPDLAAALALVTGLNGQTLVVNERADAGSRIAGAAGRAGALVDFETGSASALPVETGRYDVAVIVSSLVAVADDERAARIAEAVRTVRAGGRIVIIDGQKVAGVLGRVGRGTPRLSPPSVLALLERAALKAYRQLADVDGVAFYEGRRS